MIHLFTWIIKVIWPNRGGGFGISEIVDVVQLDTPEAKAYHEPDVIDDNIFFPMNWTFQLTCDRIRPDDCVFNPVSKGASKKNFNVQLNNLQVYPSVLKVLTLDKYEVI